MERSTVSAPRSDRPSWRKSSYSIGSGECVEVASLDADVIGVRDSKDPLGPVLRFTRAELHAFVRGVRDGEFDEFC
ncbi:MAG TPA: DUF397 domain-containing protein [Ilumatobacter sp.]